MKNIDELLQLYLYYELGEPDAAELDFSFAVPSKEWSSSIEQDMINLYLLDIDENRQLRRNEWERSYEESGIKSSKPPAMVDLYYLIMAFDDQKDPGREHTLLSDTLKALYRFDSVTKEGYGLTPELEKLIRSISLEIFPKNYLDERLGLQLWSAIDQSARPLILLKVTAPLELEIARSGPPVKSREFSFEPLSKKLYALSGRVVSEEGSAAVPVASATLTLKKGAKTVRTLQSDDRGGFRLLRVPAQSFELEVTAPGYQDATLSLTDIAETAKKPLTIKLSKQST